jgi:glutamine amidotransferase
MIVVVDYGLGNVGSIVNMFRKIGTEAIVATSEADIDKADKLILPGVGAFDNGMKNIHDKGLINVLNRNVLERKKPILGICLGMQLLSKSSEEGVLPGLGWIDAQTIKFNFEDSNQKLRIPHMGWNEVVPVKKHTIVEGMDKETRFYFVHSYHVKCNSQENELMTCDYGFDFTCSVVKDNIIGVQFHPEKSHKFGMKLLNNFSLISS